MVRTVVLQHSNFTAHIIPFSDLFRCAPPPPSLVGTYYLRPPDARAIFLHSDLLCNGTCSVTGRGGGHNVLGGGGA